MKRILLCPSSLILAWSLSATTASAANFSGLWVVNQTVPDFSIIGLNDTRNVTSDISNILGITVTLNLTGGWSGDLYAYVTNGSGFSVLLNRPGRTSANPIGNFAAALHVVFDDAAATDIHLAPFSTAITGNYQPDGRITDPAAVTQLSDRTSMLSSFHGQPAGGTWSLFISDMSSGDEVLLESWGLEINGIPEPSAAGLCFAAAAPLLLRRRRTSRISGCVAICKVA